MGSQKRYFNYFPLAPNLRAQFAWLCLFRTNPTVLCLFRMRPSKLQVRTSHCPLAIAPKSRPGVPSISTWMLADVIKDFIAWFDMEHGLHHHGPRAKDNACNHFICVAAAPTLNCAVARALGDGWAGCRVPREGCEWRLVAYAFNSGRYSRLSLLMGPIKSSVALLRPFQLLV